jgi:hypothetical protein
LPKDRHAVAVPVRSRQGEPVARAIAAHQLNVRVKFPEHRFPDIMRLAASIKQGNRHGSLILRKTGAAMNFTPITQSETVLPSMLVRQPLPRGLHFAESGTMAAEFSYYDLLGVESSATQAEIHSTYRAALLRYHPDINSAPNATRLTAMLNEAHRVLSTTVARAAYDATLASSRPTSSVSGDQWSLLSGLSAALFFPWLFAWRIAAAQR